MTPIENLLAEQAIAKAVTGYMNAIDSGRWDDVKSFFADHIFVDYTSVRPEPPAATMSRDQMIKLWQTKFAKEIAFQHCLSNLEFDVRESTALCIGHLCAHHVMPNASGEIVLWQIGVRLTWKFRLDTLTQWVIESVKGDYIWDRTEPFKGIKTYSEIEA